jgi:hypothetical protein
MRLTRRDHARLGSVPGLACWNLPPLPELDPPDPVDRAVSVRSFTPASRSAWRMACAAGSLARPTAAGWTIER